MRRTSGPSLVAVLALLIASYAHATSNRIFVSTKGNNANDCSNPLTPCLDFTGALSQVNAGGEIIAEATGPYGPLNVTTAVTISGPPGVVIYSGHQVSVNAPGATVVLRGLTIDGNGAVENGIMVTAVGALYVENCVIAGFQNGGTGLTGNGIYFKSAGQLFVKDTVIRGNAGTAVRVVPSAGSARASIVNCRAEKNIGGVICNDNGQVSVRSSVFSGNSSYATAAAGTAPAELNLDGCVIANNAIGVLSNNSGTVRVSNCTLTDNDVGLWTGTGALLSRSDNTLEGNLTQGTFTGTFSPK
jgi:hypothetical protein